MSRAELDAEFADAVRRKSAAISSSDSAAVIAASADLLRIAREILAGKSSSGRPARLADDQSAALFWAAYHPVKYAPAGKGAEAMIRFADEVEWLRSIGYEFSQKERRIVDELPFCGVPELFRRWLDGQIESGFHPDPVAGARTVFSWYRDRPSEAVSERFVDFLAENLDCDRQWFPFYYGEMLSRLGRGAERTRDREREAKEKPTDFRRWIALAECYAAVPRRIVACLAKALTCTILPADEAPAIRASLERRLRAAGRLIGRPAPRDLDAKALERLAAPTHEFLISNVPVTKGVFSGVRMSRDGKRLAEITYTGRAGEPVTLTVPMPRELERTPRGAQLRLRIVRHGEADKIIDFGVREPDAASSRKDAHRSGRKSGACGSRRRSRT